MNDFCEIQKLVELFNPNDDDANSEDELSESKPKPKTACQRPDQVNQKTEKYVNPYSKIEPKESERKEILNPDEEDDYVFEDQSNTQKEWKKTPKWNICYKQQVTAEDVFLQIGFKNPTSASCEDMIITIDLPEESRYNIDLKILKDKLTLVSPKFYLDLPLPHPVDPQKGNAKFDAETEKLIVTLRMDRELDLLNF